MKKITFSGIVLCLLFSSLFITQAQDTDEVRQWAGKAVADTQFDDGSGSGYESFQVTGAPDSACGEQATAWASADITDSETLTVYFNQAVIPSQIHIHQNDGAGAITSVALISSADSETIALENSADTDVTADDCPHVFTIEIPEDVRVSPVNGLEITLDQTLTGERNAIDAVELVGIVPVVAEVTPEPTVPTGTSIFCDSTSEDPTFTNGIEFVMQLPQGNTFAVTAIGIGDFDPIIAMIRGEDNPICEDNSDSAALFRATLPTTGDIPASKNSAQVTLDVFSNDAFVPYTIIVGSRDDMPGEFILSIEGGFADYGDGNGDVYSLKVSPGIMASDVAPSAYVLSIVDSFDVILQMLNEKGQVLQDVNTGAYVTCDDAGTASCWGQSSDLSDAYATRTLDREVRGKSLDAMITIPLEQLEAGYLLNVAALGNNAFGDYTVIYHVSIGDPTQVSDSEE